MVGSLSPAGVSSAAFLGSVVDLAVSPNGDQLYVALAGLFVITLYKLGFTGFKTGVDGVIVT